MKEVRAWILFVLSLYVIQSSLLPFFAYRGVFANLLLLFVVSFSYLRGMKAGVFCGFCTGLLETLASGTFFGIDCLSFMFIAIICGKISDGIFRDQFFLPIATSIIAGTIHFVIWALFIKILGYPFPLEENMRYTLPVLLTFQFIFAYPIHKATYLIDKKFFVNRYVRSRHNSAPVAD